MLGHTNMFGGSEFKLLPGDVIFAKRLHLYHYGIYSGEEKVIHYTDTEDDSNVKIRETSYDVFAKGDNVYVCIFGEEGLAEHFKFKSHFNYSSFSFIWNMFKIFGMPLAWLISWLKDIILGDEYKQRMRTEFKDVNLNTPEQTLKNAHSLLGENKYNLLLHNCEHFAIWAKTGIEESKQAEQFAKFIIKLGILVRLKNMVR